ncbi:oxidoreductase [Aureococcus anophagefferens]|nr:oxidoreductase [Aureococcus anophagefferens]
MTYERARASGLRSRELLGDALDTLLVHFPGSTDAVQSPKANALRRAATWEALVDLKRAGVVRRVGVSNYVPRHAREQLKYNGVPDVVQLESHPFCANAELAGLWRDAGVTTIQAYSPFASGRAPVLAHPSVRAAAAKKSTPAPSPRLAPARLEPVVKASSPGHRRDAVASLALRLGDDDLAALDVLDRGAGGSVAFDARLIA